MKTIDAMGLPCPVPVIETKKALAEQAADAVLIKVDNLVAVQNLEKMAASYGYLFSYIQKDKNFYEVTINKNGKAMPDSNAALKALNPVAESKTGGGGLAVVISRDTMGEGAEALGKILIKGFIYSLTELPVAPKCVIFLNSGAHLTSADSNTVDDLKKLEGRGTEILTCGTCVNYYGIKDKLAVGEITDMYGITQRMASADSIINI